MVRLNCYETQIKVVVFVAVQLSAKILATTCKNR